MDGLEGVTGRSTGASESARLMNCKGVKGEPFVEGEDFNDCGLWPLGVDREKEGTKGTLGSGVRGDSGGVSGASVNVAELIHFSSRAPTRGGESGIRRKLSAK
jgi:hypothetical protein